MFEVTNPFHRDFIYSVWQCLEYGDNPGASIVLDESTGRGIDAVGQYADSFFVGGECPALNVQPGEVLAVPRRGGGAPVILVSSAVQNWLENNGNTNHILGVWWDSRTDTAVLDMCSDIAGIEPALKVARARGESDIWDAVNGCCAPVSG